MLRKVLLACGILSSVIYIAMNIFVPMFYKSYSFASQTVSELSAIGAPTRRVWVWLGTFYATLVIAFGWGIWKTWGANRTLRVVGLLMVFDGALSLFWPPMHMRGAEFTATDTLHIIWSVLTVLLMMFAIGFAGMSLGQRFRLYSIATMAILVVFGVLTGMDGPNIAANLPTPWVGVWERIGIAAFMVWVVVLATILLSVKMERVPVLAENIISV